MGQGDELGILPRFCEELFERIKCWNEVLLQYDLILFKGALSSFDSIGVNVSVQIMLDYFTCFTNKLVFSSKKVSELLI